MRRSLVVALAAALVAAAVVAPAEAAKKRKPKKVSRTAEGTYANPALGIPGVVGSGAAGGAYEFGTMANENFIDIEITDAAGGSVTATLSQNSDPSDDFYEIFATICGATEAPLQISPGLPVRVSVYTTPGPEQPSCMGPATSGTIKATLSNLP